MATSRSSEDFVRLFREIKRQIGEHFDRERFKERLNSDPGFGALAGTLVNLNRAIIEAIKASGTKTLKQTHPDFGIEFKTFSTAWADFSSVYFDWKIPDIDFVELLRALENPSPRSEDTWLVQDETWDFDSDIHDAASLVEALVENARDSADWRGATFNRMAEAFDWFTKRGLSLQQFEKRWKLPPSFFAVPQHISDEYPVKGKPEGLYWLLDEAVKAFCFGCDGAAISMCRAITEELIEEHYLKNKVPNHLSQNIREAETLYPQLRNHNFGERIRIANDVLHEGAIELSKFKKWKDPENFIREWLRSLKTLIEGAPQKKR